jgi:hypothetical protein
MVRCCARNASEMLLTHVSRIVPNYDLAPDLGQVDILRVVVKENFTEALLDRLVCDLVCIRAPYCLLPLSIFNKRLIGRDNRGSRQTGYSGARSRYAWQGPRSQLARKGARSR